MFKKSSLFTLLFGTLLLAGCGNNAADITSNGDTQPDTPAVPETSELPDVIKIGYIGPLTGNVAAFGQDTKNAISAYFEENMIEGKRVEIIYEDGKCNGQDAANAAQKLVTVDKVQVILGGFCSGETLAAAPIAESNKVLLFSYGSSSPEVTTAGDYVFRNYPSDAQIAKTMVEKVAASHESVALLTEQTDYAQGYRGAIKSQLESLGKTDMLVFDDAFAADSSDFRTQLTKIKESGAEAVIIIPQSPVTGGFALKQAREIGLEVQFYGGDALVGPDFINTAQDAGEGTKAFLASEDPTRDGYERITVLLGEPQSTVAFQLFAYDAATIIAEAIVEAGYDGTALKDYLNSMPTFKGVGSDVNFDENGDNSVNASTKMVKDGEFVLVTE